MVTPVEAREGLLRVAHRLLWRVIAIRSVCDEIGAVGRTVVGHDSWVCEHLEVPVLLAEIFMLDHKLADWRLLSEIKLVHS